MKLLSRLLTAALPLALLSCSDTVPLAPSSSLTIDYEKYTLDNGLDVILHIDRSDPIVAIDLAAHVGSSRETAGRTGFAHLFEHLLFLDSENLGYGGLDEMNTRIGGDGTNGFTTHDMTQYFQAVPSDALEKIIWAEADKLGWFINTVSQNVVDNEKQVVKNEKRQRVDNSPYGHDYYIVCKTLYPEDHPYNWEVIGSLADLDAATLEDVQSFYANWYVPNNVTVTITGDFDIDQAKKWVEKYFGEIPRGQDIEPFTPRPSNLTETTSLYYEDNLATLPLLTIVWPAVEQYHPDTYALDILMEYLGDGKEAPLNALLIDDLKLTSSISTFNYSKEIAGEIYISITPDEDIDIDELLPAIDTVFTQFENDGIPQDDLDRIKAGLEVGFYNNIQSALGKAIQLGEYNLFTGNPAYYETEINAIKSVTADDVMRVYKRYIKDKPHLLLSIVPKDQLALGLEGAKKAEIVEEKIIPGEGAPVDFDPSSRVIENPTPSAFDRSIEPGFGEAYELTAPKVWRDNLANDIEVYGISSNETPLINFSLRIDAGRNKGHVEKPAIAALTADMLNLGTANKTTAELENAIKSLGSTINISASERATLISGTTLSRNFEKTMELVEEIIMEPRWDSEEFERLKSKRINQIIQNEADPRSIARRELAKLSYPSDHIFHYTTYGPTEKLETVTLDDLKSFYTQNYTPHDAKLRIVGDMNKADTVSATSSLAQRWKSKGNQQARTVLPPMNEVETSKIYFYDLPDAKQSVIYIQRPSLSAKDADYPLATAVNFPLGGIYTSELNTSLRVDKGYTYGIYSYFDGGIDEGRFRIGTSVRSNVTLESLQLIRDIVENYGPDFTQEELGVMKAALLRGQALKNETLRDKISTLGEMSVMGYPNDFRAKNAEAINAMSLEDFKSLSQKYLRPDAMTYLVVGDAATQADRLEALGFGAPIMLETQ